MGKRHNPPASIGLDESRMPHGGSPGWLTVIAAVWLVGFVAFFFCFDLPNSAVARSDLLLELADPSPPDPRHPQAAMTRFVRENSGWRFFPQRLDLLFVAGVILAGAWGLGHLTLRRIQPPLPPRCLERTVFAFGIGLSGMSLITLGCGLIGMLSPLLLGSLVATAFAAELVSRARDSRLATAQQGPGHFERQSVRDEARNARWLSIAAIVPFLVCMLLGSLLPSTDFDVNEYHFEGPKEYFQNQKITLLPHNVYTSFPFCTEMLTLLAMVLRQDWYRGALAGKATLMCFAPLTGLALFAAGRRWFGTTAGLAAAFIHLSTPWIYRVSIIAYAEGGLCFYLFLTLFAVLIGIERLRNDSDAAAESQRESPVRDAVLPPATRHPPPATPLPPPPLVRQFLLAGLLAGSALACKYPALISVVIPMSAAVLSANLIATWWGRDGHHKVQEVRRPAAWCFLIAFCIGTAISCGPWFLKNIIETGNPVYPLLYRVFGGADWDDDLNAKWVKAHSAGTYKLSDLGEKLIDVTLKSDWLSPLLFGLAVLALLRRSTRRLVLLLWLYVAFLFLSWWLLTHRIDRFWVPMIPVVSLLAGAGATWLRPEDAGHWVGPLAWKLTLGLCLALVGMFNLGFIRSPLCGYNDYLIDLNAARRFAAQATAPEIVYLNEHLPPGSKVLCVGEAQVFDATFPLVYNTVFDHSIFEAWCAKPANGIPAGKFKLRDRAEIRAAFEAAGVTHVFVNWREVLRYRASYAYTSPLKSAAMADANAPHPAGQVAGYTDFVSPDRFVELQALDILGDPWKIPSAFGEADALDGSWRQELDGWGRALKTDIAGRSAYVTFQVFPVRRQSHP